MKESLEEIKTKFGINTGCLRAIIKEESNAN